jgi:hypothetical protein
MTRRDRQRQASSHDGTSGLGSLVDRSRLARDPLDVPAVRRDDTRDARHRRALFEVWLP